MRKLLVGITIGSFALSLAAHPGSENKGTGASMGRHGYDHTEGSASVPDTSSTLALLLLATVSLGMVGLALNRKTSPGSPNL
jgi:hypothetical protein